MEQQIQRLQQMIDQSRYTVFFGGAGVSTESGVPDFRSPDGLYQLQYQYPPETIISHSFFMQNPAEFYRFYRDKMLWPQAEPNPAHRKLAELEAAGRLQAAVTQNIDGLHQAAGSRNVLELHGSVHRNYCMNCGKSYSMEEVLQSQGAFRCGCGGLVKPDVVLYEEALNPRILEQSVEHIRRAELLIVAGTSLTVYPAAGLLDFLKGKLVLINRAKTGRESQADLFIQGDVGRTLSEIQVKTS